MKKILGYMRKACDEFHMIQPGDNIAVGISGGKDSMLMIYALSLYRKYLKIDYQLQAITVDLGFGGFDTSSLEAFIQGLSIPYTVVPTEIGPIVFDQRKEKGPCSLCAKMRKGAFYEKAKQLGCNKAVFAHHMEDMLETFLLSLFFESKINTFSPVSYLSRTGITLIRPFIYVPEKEIGAVRRLNIPVSKNPCPANGNTKREFIKEFFTQLTHQMPNVKQNMLTAIRNTQNYNLWDKVYPGEGEKKPHGKKA